MLVVVYVDVVVVYVSLRVVLQNILNFVLFNFNFHAYQNWMVQKEL